MDNFSFSKTPASVPEVFYGPQFYKVYKESEFLRSTDNVQTILSKAYEIRKKMKDLEPGKRLKIEGMVLDQNTPLYLKNTTKGVPLEEFEFSLNRLTGLTAAYVFNNLRRFPKIESSEAQALGLKWNNEVVTDCRIYLSAVTGTEHFIDQFSYCPLVCSLRKYQLKKMPLPLVVKHAKIKNSDGVTMIKLMLKNWSKTVLLWKKFPGSDVEDLKSLLQSAMPELKSFCFANTSKK